MSLSGLLSIMVQVNLKNIESVLKVLFTLLSSLNKFIPFLEYPVLLARSTSAMLAEVM